MVYSIAVAGKGGTGKTTFAALLIRYLIEKGKTNILAVDADPNANLNEALGVKVEKSIGEILDEIKDARRVPSGMTKELYMEYALAQSLTETEKFDLLTMGHTEGPGCYCYPNDLLRKHLETLNVNYDYLVMDSEAGLEHISRRVIQNVDELFVLSDPSLRSIRSAGRIKKLVEDLKLPIKKMYLVLSRAPADLSSLKEEIEKTGLPLAGLIPYDAQIVDFDVRGKALFELPQTSEAVKAVNEILANNSFALS